MTRPELLCARFTVISQQKMADFPLRRDDIAVYCTSFLPTASLGVDAHHHDLIGIILLPWAINLIVLPEQFDNNQTQIGVQKLLKIAGENWLITGAFDAQIGAFWTASIASPLPDESFETLIALVDEILRQLQHNQNDTPQSPTRRQLLLGIK